MRDAMGGLGTAAAHSPAVPRKARYFLPTVRHAEHLRRAQHCALMADSALCNAHTSGTDSLWAGTPMLTLPGDNQAARVAASLLLAVGLPQLISRSLRAFEDLLAALTTDTDAAAAGISGSGEKLTP